MMFEKSQCESSSGSLEARSSEQAPRLVDATLISVTLVCYSIWLLVRMIYAAKWSLQLKPHTRVHKSSLRQINWN